MLEGTEGGGREQGVGAISWAMIEGLPTLTLWDRSGIPPCIRGERVSGWQSNCVGGGVIV